MDSTHDILSVACNSDSEKIGAPQIVMEAGARPKKRHGLEADKFSILSSGWTWQELCSNLDPVGLSRKFVTLM